MQFSRSQVVILHYLRSSMAFTQVCMSFFVVSFIKQNNLVEQSYPSF